jgi:hypothetical protein
MRLPSWPWVIAPSAASGAGTGVVDSCWSARLPTCGPLPCTITTRQPASITSLIEAAIAAALASTLHFRGDQPHTWRNPADIDAKAVWMALRPQ